MRFNSNIPVNFAGYCIYIYNIIVTLRVDPMTHQADFVQVGLAINTMKNTLIYPGDLRKHGTKNISSENREFPLQVQCIQEYSLLHLIINCMLQGVTRTISTVLHCPYALLSQGPSYHLLSNVTGVATQLLSVGAAKLFSWGSSFLRKPEPMPENQKKQTKIESATPVFRRYV